MLNFVQYGACLHLSVQNVWGSLFSGHTVYIYLTIKQAVCYCPTRSIRHSTTRQRTVGNTTIRFTVSTEGRVASRCTKKLVVITRLYIASMVLIEVRQTVVHIHLTLQRPVDHHTPVCLTQTEQTVRYVCRKLLIIFCNKQCGGIRIHCQSSNDTVSVLKP